MLNKITFAGKSVPKALRLSSDGIWYATKEEEVSYPSGGNDRCFEIEDKSFWFQHRNACIIELVKKFPPRGKGPIFDVGGGNGFVAKGLTDAGWDVVLVEPGSGGARNAKKRGLQHVVCATTKSAGFKPGCTPAIGVFDVVEHIENEQAILRHLYELLEPGGMFYLTVPAFSFLWSRHDLYAGHFRRYYCATLCNNLKKIGFTIHFSSYFFSFLLFIILIQRCFPFWLKSKLNSGPSYSNKNHIVENRLLFKFLKIMLSWEIESVKESKKILFGSSILLVAQKQK